MGNRGNEAGGFPRGRGRRGRGPPPGRLASGWRSGAASGSRGQSAASWRAALGRKPGWLRLGWLRRQVAPAVDWSPTQRCIGGGATHRWRPPAIRPRSGSALPGITNPDAFGRTGGAGGGGVGGGAVREQLGGPCPAWAAWWWKRGQTGRPRTRGPPAAPGLLGPMYPGPRRLCPRGARLRAAADGIASRGARLCGRCGVHGWGGEGVDGQQVCLPRNPVLGCPRAPTLRPPRSVGQGAAGVKARHLVGGLGEGPPQMGRGAGAGYPEACLGG